ncbi:MAG: MurR/RpiR family transcriptional regulator [Alphaproteobacteria bacterium]|jgi:DNA-binding MurR/RpiR family transcriptional regulator|nr:MurR/RpiR family transcriptional regulator [Alphaproteobacteria bacterium]
MNQVIYRITENYRLLSPAQKIIADHLIAHQEQIPHLTARDLATATKQVSSCVISFAQRIGYKGFSELKFHYENQAHALDTEILNPVIQAIELAEIATKTQEFQEAFALLKAAKKIYIYAFQMSQIPAKDFYFRMRKIAPSKVIFFEDFEDQVRMSQMMEAGDVALIISNSGNCEEILLMEAEITKKNIPQILITNGINSQLALNAAKEISIQCLETDPLLFKEVPTLARYALIYTLEKVYSMYFKEFYDESLKNLKKTSQIFNAKPILP